MSFTACIKQLIFDQVDDLKKQEVGLDNLLVKLQNNTDKVDVNKSADDKPKKNMLKNLNKIKPQ